MSEVNGDGLSSLPVVAFHRVCLWLDPLEILAFRRSCKCVFSALHDEEGSEGLWRQLLERDYFHTDDEDNSDILQTLNVKVPTNSCVSIFGVSPSEDDCAFTASTPFESWNSWTKAAARFYDGNFQRSLENKHILNGEYFLRAAKLWGGLMRACHGFPTGAKILESFEPGIRNSGWPGVLSTGTRPGADAAKAVYAFCGGQSTRSRNLIYGLFGTCHAYHYRASTYMVRPQISDDYIIVGFDPLYYVTRSARKEIVVQVTTGAVELVTFVGVVRLSRTDLADGFLVWLEEYCRRLSTGFYSEGLVDTHGPPCLTPYPQRPESVPLSPVGIPVASRVVTKGVEVIASAIYTPQCIPRFAFIYSFRIRLLTPDDGDEYERPDQRGFETCQLESRHWHIYDSESRQGDRVDGDGVIGMHPILFEGGFQESEGRQSGVFQYQSCTGMTQGFFEGHITFVPGSLENPTGDPFDVQVGRFALDNRPLFLF